MKKKIGISSDRVSELRVALCRTCHFGFFRESEKEPLATYIQGLLSELEQLIELSKKKLKDYEKAIPKAKARAVAKAKAAE